MTMRCGDGNTCMWSDVRRFDLLFPYDGITDVQVELALVLMSDKPISHDSSDTQEILGPHGLDYPWRIGK